VAEERATPQAQEALTVEVVHSGGRDGLATVHVARFRGDDRYLAEFVSSLSGSRSAAEKWVAILSTQYGCPVGCRFCDAGDHFHGNLTKDELLDQLDYLVDGRYPGRNVPTRKFKVQFARMGEPALNPAVIDALREMRTRYEAPGLMPCISTVAPEGAGDFFERLLAVKRELYDGSFQLQFSVHTTDPAMRDTLVPCRKWGLERMAEYGRRFHGGRGRKVSLNFALAPDAPVDAGVLARHFDPAHFVVKLTPVNPTENARLRGLVSPLGPGFEEGTHPAVRALRDAGFEVVISIGEPGENALGSNCGQVVGLWKKNEGSGFRVQGTG
jgi:23S rRNA (adenine2503-C2)-methyltransferase